MKYFFAVALVWFGCLVAWIALGSTLVYRSGGMSNQLTEEVDRLWGPPAEQHPPSPHYIEKVKVVSETGIEREVEQSYPLALTRSDISARLDLEHRQKGLLWFPTYTVTFDALYEVTNDTSVARNAILAFPLSNENAVYDGFRMTDAQDRPLAVAIGTGRATHTRPLEPGERFSYRVRYESRGRSEWRYRLSEGTGKVEHFRLVATGNFTGADFPAGTLSPSRHATTAAGFRGEWLFESLVSSAPIGIELPQRLNPGPLASRITFFAPVGLLFFFFVTAVLSAARARPLHPMHYFFLGCAFFAFHLLFAYLVDHVTVGIAFGSAALVSVLLVVSYGRLFAGWKVALWLLGVPQLLYLVLFSYTFFWEGYTGLSIAVGAVLTLFVIMQLTGRVRWDLRGDPRGDLRGSANLEPTAAR